MADPPPGRTLTDADVEAIADAVARRLKPWRVNRTDARAQRPDALTPEERAAVRSITLGKLARPTRKRAK